MYNAMLTKELSVETPNGVGVAAKLTTLVAEQAKANIRAAWAEGYGSKGHFSLITDNNQKALDAIKKDFPSVEEHEVLVLYVPNSLGKIEEVTKQISQAGLDIEYLFTTYYENQPAIILSTSDNQKALKLFSH